MFYKPLEKEKTESFDLPEEEEELDNLTEYNTARNKKVTLLVSKYQLFF